MPVLHLEVAGGEAALSLEEQGGVSLAVESDYIGAPIPWYSGPTNVTPSGSQQVLATAGTRLADDITVEPIPSNYGLITWNGSVITVS